MTATAATATATSAREVTPEEAGVMCATAYARLIELLRALAPDEWARPTDCTRWSIRDMAGHLAGAAENTGVVTLVPLAVRGLIAQRSLRLPELVDGMNEVQIRAHAHNSPTQLIGVLADAAPQQAALRRHPHWYGQLVRFPTMGQVLSMRELYVRVLNRDLWIHRVDICRASGRAIELTPDHDGRLVEDVVAAWAARHRKPFTLHLTGPAGGTYAQGVGGDELEVDGVEFCRTVSGRAPGDGLLATTVIF